MKKQLAILLTLALLLALCACGSQPAEESAAPTEAPAIQTEEPATPTEAPAAQTEAPAPQTATPAPALSTPAVSSSSSGGGFSMTYTPSTMPPMGSVNPTETAEIDPLQVDYTPMELPDFSVVISSGSVLEVPDLSSPFEAEMPDLNPSSYIKKPAPPLNLADHLTAAQVRAPGQAAKGNSVELSVSRAFFCQNLTPEDPDQVYVGYEAPEGMRLLVMEGEIRNLGKEDLKIDTLGFFSQYPFLALAYCDEGLYQGILVMGSADGKTLVDELPAGATQRCYVFFSVPEKAARTKDPVALFFGCSDFSDDVFLGTGNLRYDGTAIEWERCDFLAFWAFSETASVKNSCDA